MSICLALRKGQCFFLLLSFRSVRSAAHFLPFFRFPMQTGGESVTLCARRPLGHCAHTTISIHLVKWLLQFNHKLQPIWSIET